VSISLYLKQLPLIGDTYQLVDEGCIPGAAFRNLDYAETDTFFASDIDYNLKMIAFDAQTSGGLLISVMQSSEESLISELKSTGSLTATKIGEVFPYHDKSLFLE
jgi:selenide, water dikinase